MRRWFRRYGAMLRAGWASTLAYRAEFFIWILTTNLPLVNLALWSAVAHDAPVQGWDTHDFAAYFLAALVVRLLTGCWLVWEFTQDVKQGTLAMRLLRPVHPLLAYSAENIAQLPLRALLGLPIMAVLVTTLGWDALAHTPLQWLGFAWLVLGAWTMVFLVMAVVGALALLADSARGLWEVWFGLFTVFSGYLVPLDLFPEWIRGAARLLPFRYLLDAPVQALLGRLDTMTLLETIAGQAAWIGVFGLVLAVTWRAGIRRFAAFGG